MLAGVRLLGCSSAVGTSLCSARSKFGLCSVRKICELYAVCNAGTADGTLSGKEMEEDHRLGARRRKC